MLFQFIEKQIFCNGLSLTDVSSRPSYISKIFFQLFPEIQSKNVCFKLFWKHVSAIIWFYWKDEKKIERKIEIGLEFVITIEIDKNV